MLAAPVMVKLEVPAVLLIAPSRSKVANVCVVCRSNVPLLSIIRSVDVLKLPVLVSLTVPLLMVVSPV